MNPDPRPKAVLKKIRILTSLFIVGLFVSGVTAIPLMTEVSWLVNVTGAEAVTESASPPVWAVWLVKVKTALQDVNATHTFLFYGTDWLAFGHFVIALAFVGALRDPVRNRWLFTFGLISCALVIPYAMIFGAMRGIPTWWRVVDCSFGVIGCMPLWFCWKWVNELEESLKADPR
jgi:hypothetical protein